MKDGKGTLEEKDGARYEGTWLKNQKSGEGVYRFKDKTYEGSFLENKFEGKGKLTYSNQDVYEG